MNEQEIHSSKKWLFDPVMSYLFWRLFIFYLLVRSKGRLVGRIYGIVCTICSMCFHGKFVMPFIDIGVTDCMIIPKCHWMVIVVNLVKQIDFFFGTMPPVGVVLYMPGQFQVFPPLAAIIPPKHIWHACYKALQVFFKDFCPFICPSYLFGAQDPIWHHCEKLPRRVLNHHQLGHYKPGTFAGSAHQVNDVPFPDTLVYWEPSSWPTSVGTTRNTVIKLALSRIWLAVIVLQAAGIGLIGRPVVTRDLSDKCHSLQLQNHHAHFPPLRETHIHANTTMRNWWWKMKHCFEALHAGPSRRNPVWSGKESHWSLRGWMDGRTDGQTDGQTSGRTDRQTDRWHAANGP